MNIDKNINKGNRELKKEDTTKYGEFVCSCHHWLPIEKQKNRAEELANITKEDNKKNEEK